MKLICPSCGAVHSAEGWGNDGDARQCMRIIAELPGEVSRRALGYLALFRPGTGKGLTWCKALKLLGELQAMTKAGHVQWEGKPARPCTPVEWGQGMERVIEVPPKRLPLKSHGYLRAIVYEIAEEVDKGREKKLIQAERDGTYHREVRKEEPGEALTVEKMREIREKNKQKRRSE